MTIIIIIHSLLPSPLSLSLSLPLRHSLSHTRNAPAPHLCAFADDPCHQTLRQALPYSPTLAPPPCCVQYPNPPPCHTTTKVVHTSNEYLKKKNKDPPPWWRLHPPATISAHTSALFYLYLSSRFPHTTGGQPLLLLEFFSCPLIFSESSISNENIWILGKSLKSLILASFLNFFVLPFQMIHITCLIGVPSHQPHLFAAGFTATGTIL